MPPRVHWKRSERALLATVLAGLVVWRNHRFADYAAHLVEKSDKTTDVYFILQGYHRAPDLWRDGLAWWHGHWIHTLTPYFRPVGSYIHWTQCYVGLKWGFVWVAYVGLAVFWVDCLLAAVLAWRITRSKICTALSAATLPFVLDFNPGQPGEWIAWFPGHPDLIVGGLLLGAVLCLDLWIERARRHYLLGAWGLFLVACGVKEHAYIFPAMALALALLRTGRVRRGGAITQTLLLFVAAGALLAYRKAVVPDALGPGMDPEALAVRTLLFLYPAFYASARLGQTQILLLAILLFLQGWTWLRLRRVERIRHWLSKPFAPVAVFFAMLALAAAFGLATGTLILFADPLVAMENVSALSRMWFSFYAVILFFRYRRRYPTALSWMLLWLAYVPVFHTVGWLYTLTGWLFRAQYWALVTQLIAVEWHLARVGHVLESRLALVRRRFAHEGDAPAPAR